MRRKLASLTVLAFSGSLTSTQMTSQPSAVYCRASSRPSPCAAPVTSTISPLISFGGSLMNMRQIDMNSSQVMVISTRAASTSSDRCFLIIIRGKIIYCHWHNFEYKNKLLEAHSQILFPSKTSLIFIFDCKLQNSDIIFVCVCVRLVRGQKSIKPKTGSIWVGYGPELNTISCLFRIKTKIYSICIKCFVIVMYY